MVKDNLKENKITTEAGNVQVTAYPDSTKDGLREIRVDTNRNGKYGDEADILVSVDNRNDNVTVSRDGQRNIKQLSVEEMNKLRVTLEAEVTSAVIDAVDDKASLARLGDLSTSIANAALPGGTTKGR